MFFRFSFIFSANWKTNLKRYSFLERGSDERQYCSPGVDLLLSGFCRSKYGEFKEYHTSADNLNLVSEKYLQESFLVFKSIIDSFEDYFIPISTTKCEPNLGKRNLYSTISQKKIIENQILFLIFWLTLMEREMFLKSHKTK